MKIPDLTKNFTKTFKSVIKNLIKNQKIKKEEPLLSVLPCRQNPWKKKMCQILEGNDL